MSIVATGSAMIQSARADFDAGFAAYSQGDYATALREWQSLAEAGDPRAQVGLGFMHEKGLGVPQDHTKAVRWYRSGSEQGDAIAEYNLAVMYGNGTGVLRDYVKAFALFSLSSGHGNTEAANSLSYIERLMTPLELSQAKDLLTLADEDRANATRIVLSDAPPPTAPAVDDPAPAPQVAAAPAPQVSDPAPAAVAAPVVAAPVVEAPAVVAAPVVEAPAVIEAPAAPAPAVVAAPVVADPVIAAPVVADATPIPAPAASPAPAEIAIRPAAEAATIAAPARVALAAPAAAAPAEAAPPGTATGWRVHMASLRSEAAAVTEWQRLKQRHAGELGDMKLIVQPIDLPEKGRFFRVLAGPIVDKDKADQLCAILTASDQYCRALR